MGDQRRRKKRIRKMKRIRIGTRGSRLAVKQTAIFVEKLKYFFPNLSPEIKIIKTRGDIDKSSPLYRRKEAGFFTREIEKYLIENKIDIAVHSFKDMPTEIDERLLIGAVLERENPLDVLITIHNKKLSELPKGARIGTGSLRRRAQILHFREDLEIIDIRGNLDTRLKKLSTLDLDGIIVAYAGVKRLGFEQRITEIISPEILIPAASQGAIGIQVRKKDEYLIDLLKKINHDESYIATMAERSFLKKLNAGCSAPVGVYCRLREGIIDCISFISSIDGKNFIFERLSGSRNEYENIGYKLAEKLLSNGGIEILNTVTQQKKA